MNRERKFRGMRFAYGEWVYGYLNYSEQQDRYYIGVTEIMHPVDPETVGDYIGIKDKKDKYVFEDDIVAYHINKGSFDVGVIEWCYDRWMFKYPDLDEYMSIPSESRIEVIGNIHENPELI